MSEPNAAGAADKIVLPKPKPAGDGAANRINMPKPRQPGDAAAAAAARSNAPKAPDGKAAVPAKSGLRKKVILASPFILGIAGYFIGDLIVGATPPPKEEEHHGPALPIDEAIDDYRFELVLTEVRTLQKKAVGDARAALRFREALCLESLDKPTEAAELYADLAELSPTSTRGVAARLGEIRCLAKVGRLADARRQVAQIILNSNIPAMADPLLSGEVLITKATIELALLPPIAAPHPARPDGLASSLRRPDFPRHLAWAGPLPLPEKHGHDDHAHPTGAKHDDHGKSKDGHGKGTKHDDHSTPKNGHAPAKHDDHAPKAAPRKDEHHDDHAPAKKDAPKNAPKKDEHHDDHAPKAAPKKDEHHDDHPPAKKDAPKAAPKKDEHHDDHPPAKKDAPKAAPKKDDHHEHLVAFLGDAHPPAPPKKNPPAATGLVVDDATGPDETARMVTGKGSATTVPEALDELAKAAGMTLHIAKSVRERLESRPIELNVRDIWLPDLLDVMTSPLGTIWEYADGRLLILPEPTDLPAKRDRARRALATALENVTEHPWQPALVNELGNLDFAEGKHRDAIAWYKRISVLPANLPESAHASYNLGLIYLKQGERSRGREQMMALVDRAPSSKWASLAYWWIGRSYLDGGDPARALIAFRQAIAMGRDTPAGMASILGAAVAAYQTEDFDGGLEGLRPHTKTLKIDGFRTTASFLIAYGRYRTAARPKVTGEADDLLFATMEMPVESMLGPAIADLLGSALIEFGFRSGAMDVYGSATKNLRGPLACRMMLADAELYWADGRRTEARDRFLAVASTDGGPEGRRARLRLAEIAVQSGQYSAAIQYAKESMAPEDRAKALQLMGRGYEGLRDFARAAQCFAGELPD